MIILKRLFFTIMLAVTAFALISTPALADETIWSGQGNIEHGGHTARSFEANAGDTITIEVNADRNIDVILTTESGYQEYLDPTAENFDYYPDGTTLNESAADISFGVTDNGKYYIILDNSNIPEIGAMPSGNVNYTIDARNTGLAGVSYLLTVCAVLLIIVVVILAVAAYAYYAKKGVQEKPEYTRSPIYQQSKAKGPMNCPSCGAYSDSGLYCTKCGRRLR